MSTEHAKQVREAIAADLDKHIAGMLKHEARLTPVLDRLLHDLMRASAALRDMGSEP